MGPKLIKYSPEFVDVCNFRVLDQVGHSYTNTHKQKWMMFYVYVALLKINMYQI